MGDFFPFLFPFGPNRPFPGMGRTEPLTGKEQLELLCPPLDRRGSQRAVRWVAVVGAWRRGTARALTPWLRGIAWTTDGRRALVVMVALGGTLGVGLGSFGVAGATAALPWVLTPLVLCFAGITACQRVIAVLGVQGGERRDTPLQAMYIGLRCAMSAPRPYRAAWWRRVRADLGEHHAWLGGLLEIHATDGGIPGLMVREIVPLLESDRADVRLSALTALAQAAEDP